MKPEDLRSVLLQDIQQRLLTIFIEKGFVRVPLPPEEASSDLKKAFPLGRLKRVRGNKLDIVEFQFDKYGRPKFVINFGIVPEGGVTLPWGDHLDQNVADVAALTDAYRLCSSSLRKRWFEPGLLSSRDERAIRQLVDKAICLSIEIDQWFESRVVGRHMKTFGLPVNSR